MVASSVVGRGFRSGPTKDLTFDIALNIIFMGFFYDACIIFLCDFIYFTRCRLRKKTWKNPGSIYLDNQVYEDDVPIFANWEVFLQILDG